MGKKVAKLILMRHGQSVWNKQNLFTGWVDIPLSMEGIQESLEGGKKISHIPMDVIFVSTLIRAQMTAFLVMAEHSSGKIAYIVHGKEEGKLFEWSQVYDEETKKTLIPVFKADELNERMYGQLQGLNKQHTIDKYGAEQVRIWRRSYDVAPPGGESLAMTAKRSIPFFQKNIVPYLEKGKNVFVSAHGNSLRSIVMHIEKLSKEQVLELEMDTGSPLIYNYSDGLWQKSDG